MASSETLIELLAGETQKGESVKSIQACNDFLRLGAGRSLPGLLEKYRETGQDQPPTKSIGTLKDWSVKYSWFARATIFDAQQEERKNAERQRVMEEGLALDYERVTKLKRLADFLESQIFETDEQGNYSNVWVPDAKGIGQGDNFERVDIEHFNSPLLAQYRGILEDIAKETGGRVAKQHVDTTLHGDPNSPLHHVHSGEMDVNQKIEFITAVAGVLKDAGIYDDGSSSDTE